MADIKGIELASEIYGLKDETARGNTETNTSAIGTLADLETTAKTNLVAAINEVNSKTDDWEDITSQIQRTANIISGEMKLLRKGDIIYFQCQNIVISDEGQIRALTLASGFPIPQLDWLPIPCWGSQGAFRPLSIRTNGTLSSAWASTVVGKTNGSVMYKAS